MRRGKGRSAALHRRYGRAQQAIGKGAKGYLYPHHKYAIVGLVRKGGRHLKTRYVVGRARDAHEALSELLAVRANGGHGWDYVVMDLAAGKGKLTPIVTESELRARASTGG